MTREFSVLATSGWQGDGWSLIAVTESRAQAKRIADAIYSPNARHCGHIVAVCGQAKPDGDFDFGWRVDTSRVRVSERHLKSRRCLVNGMSFETEDGPQMDLVEIAKVTA